MVHANELLTCIPLHFVVGKESHLLFTTDLKPFFDFAKQITTMGVKARNDQEKYLFPFEDVTYPMDMSPSPGPDQIGISAAPFLPPHP